MWWKIFLGVVAGILLVYLVLIVLLWRFGRRQPDRVAMRYALGLLPHLVVLVRGLASDDTVATGVRVRIVLILIYLASPIDLIPDFVPLLGYSDDLLIVAVGLRSVIRRAGSEALQRHWPGTAGDLELLQRLAGAAPTGA